MELWFVLINGEEVGPLQADSVVRGIEMGRVLGTTKMRNTSTAAWQDARDVAHFARHFGASQAGMRAAAPAPASNRGGSFESSGSLNALVGQELAGFRLTSLLGEGGMAVVFRGENTLDTSITRAIKVVRPELSSNPEFVKRFTEEARTLERLQHPNVVRFFGLRRERGLLVMELELLTGDSLVTYMKRAPRGLPVEDAVRLLAEASEGVAAAHALGIVHRDLKPENLFLTAGALKVLDFGIARAIDDADRAGKLTQVGTTLGTPAYMAPEVCNGATPSETTDVYALGLTLFEVLAGYHPLVPDSSARLSSAQIMFAHVNKSIPDIAQVRPDIPSALADIVARAVAKDPRDRFRDAATLAAALRTIRPSVSHTQHASHDGNPATRFDIPHLGAGPEQRISHADVGQSTSFALPSLGNVTPMGGRPSLASRPSFSEPAHGAQTGFGVPTIDRMRTTGGAAVIQRESPHGTSKGVMIGGGLVAMVVMGGMMYGFATKGGGAHGAHGEGEHAAGNETAQSAAAASGSARVPGAASAAGAMPAGPSDEANHWIRVDPPPGQQVLLGVPDNTPAAMRGLRYARRLVAPPTPFEIQQHEVTWGEVSPWLAKNPTQKVSEPPGLPTDAAGRKLLPVTGIMWDTARLYCKSIGASLPREDEWEYAARGARLNAFPWGNDALDLQRTNAFGGATAKLKPVMTNDQDQTPVPDAVAIFDMMGNAREWTADLYREDKPPKSPGDESWVQDGNMSWRTVRGLPLEEKPQKGLDNYTAAYRSEMCGSGACPKGTEQRRQFVGFRCVRRPTGGGGGGGWSPASPADP